MKYTRYVIGILMLFVVVICGFNLCKLSAYAGTYDNAYTFYNYYGNRMCFIASSETDGNIYCATRAKRTSSNILFSNIGWKATVSNAKGTVLQEIYFKMGGSYWKTTDVRTADNGYEYSLYAVSLKDFKSRLNNNALKALEAGNCNVVFDACIIVKHDGVPSGDMTDSGISWGSVYTTYAGIINAEDWSTTTQNSLLSYYDKEVEGLFYKLTLSKDSGIASVSGAGKYCYGTKVSISATPATGYDFSYWNGTSKLTAAKSMVTITKDMAYTAYSKRKSLSITYYRNYDASDNVTKAQTLAYGTSGQRLMDFGWEKSGYYQAGWKLSRLGLATDYTKTYEVSTSWINSHIPSLSLYASWKPNRYTIVFDANGAYDDIDMENEVPIMQDRSVNYESVFTLPECEFEHQKATFLGWSLKADDIRPSFYSSDSVTIEQLAKGIGVENSDGAIITLYAVWDKMPAIDAADVYVSLNKAQNGYITESWLSTYASANDKEDGKISYGEHEMNAFVLVDFDAQKYIDVTKEGCFEETFLVRDSLGNSCTRTIRIFLVDTDVYSQAEAYGEVRFISDKYFRDTEGVFVSEKNGGLAENSIWRCDEEFLRVLEEVLNSLP